MPEEPEFIDVPGDDEPEMMVETQDPMVPAPADLGGPSISTESSSDGSEESTPSDSSTPEVPLPDIVTDTAFLVYRDPNGHWVADDDIDKVILKRRDAGFNDFYEAACVIKKDIETLEAVQGTVQGFMQAQQMIAKQMAAAQQNAQIAQAIGDPGAAGVLDLSKIKRS